MCRVMEEMIFENSCRNAVNLLRMGKLSVEDIAEGIDLPLETVKELAEKYAESVNTPN